MEPFPWAGGETGEVGIIMKWCICYWRVFPPPLVLSVHSIVSFDFAVSQLPGWHTTIFPPYFVAGAIFSGFGMVVTLMCLIRGLVPTFKHYVTLNHMENMNKIIMATGLMVGYAYASEFFYGLVFRFCL